MHIVSMFVMTPNFRATFDKNRLSSWHFRGNAKLTGIEIKSDGSATFNAYGYNLRTRNYGVLHRQVYVKNLAPYTLEDVKRLMSPPSPQYTLSNLDSFWSVGSYSTFVACADATMTGKHFQGYTSCKVQISLEHAAGPSHRINEFLKQDFLYLAVTGERKGEEYQMLFVKGKLVELRLPLIKIEAGNSSYENGRKEIPIQGLNCHIAKDMTMQQFLNEIK